MYTQYPILVYQIERCNTIIYLQWGGSRETMDGGRIDIQEVMEEVGGGCRVVVI